MVCKKVHVGSSYMDIRFSKSCVSLYDVCLFKTILPISLLRSLNCNVAVLAFIVPLLYNVFIFYMFLSLLSRANDSSLDYNISSYGFADSWMRRNVRGFSGETDTRYINVPVKRKTRQIKNKTISPLVCISEEET